MRVELRQVDAGQGPRMRYLFIGQQKRLLFTIPAQAVELDDVDVLLNKLGVTAVKKSIILSLNELRREFPDSVPAWLTRPGLVGMGLAVVMFGVIVLLLFVTHHWS